MKKLLSFFLLLGLFVGCQSAAASDISFAEIEHTIGEKADPNGEFTKADDDFIKANFDFADQITKGSVYLKNEGGVLAEYGIFTLDTNMKKADVIEEIRAYLLGECDAMRALAALYPGNTLSENLKRYENAMIASSGDYVWYFAIDQKQATAANDAARDLLS